MRQTFAILLDAYRELNSKKLFWISLSISLAIVIALALPVQTQKGISVFGAKLESGPLMLLGAQAISNAAFYKFIFSWIGINLWLGWGATILALISTASMIPDLVSSGSIELTLAKPIGRIRLFLTKFCAGLVFVGLQAGIFSLGTIVVIGLRAGQWDARPLLVVPIMVAFFSFLHCISILVGLITRSTLMALIVVLLMMLFFSVLGTVENVFFQQRIQAEQSITRFQEQSKALSSAVAVVDAQLERLSKPDAVSPAETPEPSPTPSTSPKQDADAGQTADPAAPSPPARGPRRNANRILAAGQRMLDAATDNNIESLRARREQMNSQISGLKVQLDESNDSLSTIRTWHRWLYGTFTFFPKTGETKELFQRWVIDKSDWAGFLKMLDQISGGDGGASAQDASNKRPLWWILGTSFGFEFVVLGIATWIFARRDF